MFLEIPTYFPLYYECMLLHAGHSATLRYDVTKHFINLKNYEDEEQEQV